MQLQDAQVCEANLKIYIFSPVYSECIMHDVCIGRALKARKKMGGDNMPVHMIGDTMASELSHMQAYIRFCSCQLNGATLLQQRTDQEPDFKTFLKVAMHISLATAKKTC